MAVIKSSLVGSARKSVGDVNFYRIKGVQLIRTKATFPPSRQFTDAQLLQQKRMRLAQSVMNEFWLTRFSDFCVVRNPKRYNASNRTNILVSKIVRNITRALATTYNSGFNLLQARGNDVLRDFATGNVSAVDLFYTRSIAAGIMTCSFSKMLPTIEELLFKANRTRRPGYYLTYDNLIFMAYAGGVQNYPDDPQIGLPTLANVALSASGDNVVFKLPLYYNDGEAGWQPSSNAPAFGFYGVLAVADRQSTTNDIPYSPALACTNAFFT